jgi:uncharacterized protein YjbI with pentapeptide repeats
MQGEEHRVDQDRQSRWRQIIRNVLWTVGIYAALVVAIILVLGYVREWEWTGLVKDKAYTKRTLWDWLQLLIIPAVLAGVGLWFNRQQREQELQTADRRAQEEALQAYLDQMSDMLIPNNDQPSLSDEHPPDSLKTVARARTLTVLPRLDGGRKPRVVQFLHEAGLITKGRPIVDLAGADLSGANLIGPNLTGADLSKAYLSEAYLSEADLREAILNGANLSKANLRGVGLIRGGASVIRAYLRKANLLGTNLREADLSKPNPGADLRGADLSRSDLSYANLRWAGLSRADLSYANLQGAALWTVSLIGADLSGAKGITNEQLARQAWSLEGATMPDGYEYEEWLKDREKRRQDE